MKCVLVSHSHWDREWYRTFQSFRARLVDLIDRVLDLVAEDEVHARPAAYLWTAPDGSAVMAYHLAEGYFAASGLPVDPHAATHRLEQLARALAGPGEDGPVLLMNGFDHALPEPHAGAV